MEGAAGRDGARARRSAGNRDERLVLQSFRMRQRVEERAGVRMTRRAQDGLAGARLDDLPRVEDRNAVGDRRHDAQVVRDEDDRQVVLAAQAVEQPQDACLHGDVESCRRLIGDQQLGLTGERDRDRDPLPHASRELVRERAQSGGGIRDADVFERRERLLLGFAPTESEMPPHVFGELTADREHGVERRQRILEDHRQLATGDFAQVAARHPQQVVLSEADAPLHDGAVRQKPEQGQHRDRLAAAALACDAEHLAVLDGIVDAVDDRHEPACRRQTNA